jgi:outer membrane protein assembly factor BamD
MVRAAVGSTPAASRDAGEVPRRGEHGVRMDLCHRRAPLLRLVMALLLAGSMLAACSSTPEDPNAEFADQSVDQLYNEAQDMMAAGTYADAAAAFEEVDRQHPYSQWATRAQMMSAFAYYQANEYDQAIVAAQRFIELHPGHGDVPYAYYLIGMCYYEQISDVGRDQEMTQKALDSMGELVRRFPQTDYARDAQLKIDLARDHLAGKEMEIGRYYLRQKAYVAAINRFRNVVETYQTTTHVPEALHRLTEAYLAIGVREEAQNAAAVLGYNFPGNEWYQRSYALLEEQNLQPAKSEGSWLSSLF